MSFLLNPMTGVYVLAALIPAAVLLFYVYRHDKIEKEPPKLLLLLLLGGVLAIPPAILLETVLGRALNWLIFFTLPLHAGHGTLILHQILDAFLVVACVEEGCKLLFLKLFSWKNPNFNYVFDAVVYAVFVSLGFAALENVMYVFQYGMATAIARAVTAVPGHLSFSVFMGIFYGRAKLCEVYGDRTGKRKNLALAFAVPVFFHGFYDACAMIGGGVAMLVFLVFVIFMYIIVFRLLRAASKYDRPLV